MNPTAHTNHSPAERIAVMDRAIAEMRDMLTDASIFRDAMREALGLQEEPHQTTNERMLEAARGAVSYAVKLREFAERLSSEHAGIYQFETCAAHCREWLANNPSPAGHASDAASSGATKVINEGASPFSLAPSGPVGLGPHIGPGHDRPPGKRETLFDSARRVLADPQIDAAMRRLADGDSFPSQDTFRAFDLRDWIADQVEDWAEAAKVDGEPEAAAAYRTVVGFIRSIEIEGTKIRPVQGGFTDEAEDDMCPNCVTPWKCNGPHISNPRPGESDSEYESRCIEKAEHQHVQCRAQPQGGCHGECPHGEVGFCPACERNEIGNAK